MKCEPKKKVDFIMNIFETCEMTQTYIFVNTKQFAETLHRILQQNKLASYIMFSKMQKEERDETMAKFRDGKINVLIATDLISRGVDVPDAELVINFDVPTIKVQNQIVPDSATYMHRIGRTGRFGRPGLALTLHDRDQDKETLDKIIKYFDMQSKINPLEGGADQLKELLREMRD